MCGPSEPEKQLQTQEASFDQTLQQDYSTAFANNQEILNSLNTQLQPILEAGPSQQGFSPAELASLNSTAVNSSAEGYQQVAQALGQKESAEGGGTEFLPSGMNAQINATAGSAAENQKSQELTQIQQQNYAQGNQNYLAALGGEENVAGQQNPLGYAGATTNSNQAAFGEANTINQESNQEFSDILGGITGVGSAALGGLGNLDTTGSSSSGEQFSNFLEGL